MRIEYWDYKALCVWCKIKRDHHEYLLDHVNNCDYCGRNKTDRNKTDARVQDEWKQFQLQEEH